jgi:hypothetical protein
MSFGVRDGIKISFYLMILSSFETKATHLLNGKPNFGLFRREKLSVMRSLKTFHSVVEIENGICIEILDNLPKT